MNDKLLDAWANVKNILIYKVFDTLTIMQLQEAAKLLQEAAGEIEEKNEDIAELTKELKKLRKAQTVTT